MSASVGKAIYGHVWYLLICRLQQQKALFFWASGAYIRHPQSDIHYYGWE
ncbi:hypothetical protein [Chryseobacterium limigenitum]|nr:hypothetical protein [Chryseobacterium limigenitum]